MRTISPSRRFTVSTKQPYPSWIPIAWVSLMLAATIPGCGQQTTAPSSATLKNTVNPPEVQYVAYPEFINWNQFPIGTTVVRESEIVGPTGLSTETMTLELVDKSEQSLTVRMQVKVVHPDSVIENPPFEIKHRARVRVPTATADLSLPRTDAQSLGEETLNVLGEEVAAEVYTWTDTVEAGPMKVKLWRSQDFPGRTLRRETQVTDKFGREVSSTQTITFLDIPTAEQPPMETEPSSSTQP
ncbi:MAG: hypothetical protein NXI32_26740 [bacterium]|nr:hypothetical protein [bacterium]